MEAFLTSTGLVALAEIGDKTQLLSLVLAARFRKPVPIILGIFVATLLNHAGAGVLGAWIMQVLGPDLMRWILGLTFLGMAAWTLIPDKLDDSDTRVSRFGVFGATVIAFFLAEMGDKTQLATIALAAQFSALVAVVVGTTLGMMLANAPAVLLGERITKKLPLPLIRRTAATLFAALGFGALLNLGHLMVGARALHYSHISMILEVWKQKTQLWCSPPWPRNTGSPSSACWFRKDQRAWPSARSARRWDCRPPRCPSTLRS